MDKTRNPMIGGTPEETIENATGALHWLESLTPHVVDAFGGWPNDSIQMGRFLLGQCCTHALEAAAHELGKSRAKANKKDV
jgi:hypothetical protein